MQTEHRGVCVGRCVRAARGAMLESANSPSAIEWCRMGIMNGTGRGTWLELAFSGRRLCLLYFTLNKVWVTLPKVSRGLTC